MKLRLTAAFAAAYACAAAPFAAFAQPILSPDSSVTGDDPDGTFAFAGDAFGAAAATWDDWLFVGAPRETTFRDDADFQDGAVYIYKKDADGAYAFMQKLTMPGNSELLGDRFGGGVEAEAGWLFVAVANDQDFPGLIDPRDDEEPDRPPFFFAGKVHVYQLNDSAGTWDFVQTLRAPTPKTSGSFGARTQASHIALHPTGRVAIIGELNNFTDGLGQLHAYRVNAEGGWQYVGSNDAPSADLDTFGDDLVFANERYLVVGGADISDDGLTAQGFAYVYDIRRRSERLKLSRLPDQTIAGEVVSVADCVSRGGTISFASRGLDAGGGVVAIADACTNGEAGAFAGKVQVFRVVGGPLPLALEATIEGDEPDLYIGGNDFGSRYSLAVSPSGARILISTSLAPSGDLDDGADVRVYADGPGGWLEESNLTTPTPATGDLRSFGDTVFFTDDETAFVREGNFISPVVTGRKSQGFFYDLTP